MTQPFKLHHGDCIEVMRAMPDNSVDSVVTDPPYELGFMGKKWDATGVANDPVMWSEVLRVLKPGGHLLAFSGSRTYHRMTCAIEDAGFDIRDQIMWVYASGFPKSLNVSKAVDGHVSNGRSDSLAIRVVNETRPGAAIIRPTSTNGHRGIVGSDDAGQSVKRDTPATSEGEQWQGWGTALKPAHEPICVARKPLVGTVAANVLVHGTGALNIDGCRVGLAGGTAKGSKPQGAGNGIYGAGLHGACEIVALDAGRWPANLIHDGSDEVVACFPDAKGQQGSVTGKEPSSNTNNVYGNFNGRPASNPRSDTGSAARFFYCAKASRADRNEGLASSSTPAVVNGATMREREDADWSTRNGNHHPTVKPTELMAYLCRLVTPPNGTVLDPFMGSGSTGKAAIGEGFTFIGIEREQEYIDIARARIEHACGIENNSIAQENMELF